MRDGRDTSDLTSDALIDLIVKTDVQTNTHITAKKSVSKRPSYMDHTVVVTNPWRRGGGGVVDKQKNDEEAGKRGLVIC